MNGTSSAIDGDFQAGFRLASDDIMAIAEELTDRWIRPGRAEVLADRLWIIGNWLDMVADRRPSCPRQPTSKERRGT